MNSENIKDHLDMGAQVVSKRENLGKSGEIFTVRMMDCHQTYAADSQSALDNGITGLRTNCERRSADECGPDLFFEIWDFTDTPQDLVAA